MFDFIVNLMLTGLFLNARAQDQMAVDQLSAVLTPADFGAAPAPLADWSARSLLADKAGRAADKAPQKQKPEKVLDVKTSAKSALAIDKETGKILYQKNPTEVRSLASLTKVMTALVFLDHNPGWNKTIKIGVDDYQAGNITYLIAGEQFTVRDVFKTMLIASANEAVMALVDGTGLKLEEFVAAMNAKAQNLGLKSMSFSDPTGLSPDNQGTAADMIKLWRLALNSSEISSAVATKEYEIEIINKNQTRKIASTNKILRQDFGFLNDSYRIMAGKTGYLEKAGYCFASEIADVFNHKVLAVVLGSESLNDRFNDTKSLAYWVFNNYQW